MLSHAYFASAIFAVAGAVWACAALLRSPSLGFSALAPPMGIDAILNMVSIVSAMNAIPNHWISDLPPVGAWWLAVAVAGWLPLEQRRLARVTVGALALFWVGSAVVGGWTLESTSFAPSWWRVTATWSTVTTTAIAVAALLHWVRTGLSPSHVGIVAVGLVTFLLPSSLWALALAGVYEHSPSLSLALTIAVNLVTAVGAATIAIGARRAP